MTDWSIREELNKEKKITFKTEDPPSHNKINKGAEQNEDDNYT